jgi:3-oxoacyl-[acyl-carrier-protein] synthase II
MLAGGSESCLDAVSILGFRTVRALTMTHDISTACLPLDENRSGFVIGEGAGMLVLESYESAKKRKATIYAELRGYGTSNDAFHATKPPEDGRGARLAMVNALVDSGLAATNIAHVNLHATGTPIGDEAEFRAILSLFGEEHLRKGNVRISATKSSTGHCLGASGAIEAIFTILALRSGIAPATVGLSRPLSDILLGCASGELQDISFSAEAKRYAAMSNSFGFGGTNASLVFSLPPPSESCQ